MSWDVKEGADTGRGQNGTEPLARRKSTRLPQSFYYLYGRIDLYILEIVLS